MRDASDAKFDTQSLGVEPRAVKNARSNLRAPIVLIPSGGLRVVIIDDNGCAHVGSQPLRSMDQDRVV